MSNVTATTQPKTFKELIKLESYQRELGKALPKGVTPERIEKIIISAMNKQPALLECTPQSMYQACMECATLNLWPGPQGHMYMIPRNNKVKENGGERWEKQSDAMIGFRGMIELAYRSGKIVPGSFIAQVVRDGDVFDIEYGSTNAIKHRPLIGNTGPIIAAWAGAKPIEGDFVFHVMSYAEIDAIRKRSKSSGTGPWMTDWAEMACKTVVRRLWKYLPSSVIENFIDAIERDTEREIDLKAVSGRVVSDGDSRFSDDEPAPQQQPVDAVTEEVAPVVAAPIANAITPGQCIELAKQLPADLTDNFMDKVQCNSIGDLTPEHLQELHAILSTAMTKKGKK